MINVSPLLINATLEKIASTEWAGKSHLGLLKEFEKKHPDYEFYYMAEKGNWTIERVIDENNKTVSNDVSGWVEEMFSASTMPNETLEQIKTKEYKVAKAEGAHFYVGVKTGVKALNYIQIQVEVIEKEYVTNDLSKMEIPKYKIDKFDMDDIVNYAKGGGEVIQPKRYGKVVTINTKTFITKAIALEETKKLNQVKKQRYRVSEDNTFKTMTRVKDDEEKGTVNLLDIYPEYLNKKSASQRLFEDWDSSSAGENAVFSHYWYLEFNDNTGFKNVPSDDAYMGVIPQWCNTKNLPKISLKPKDTYLTVLDKLNKFDIKIGHPFAWYFYMLHGNRIDAYVAQFIVEGIKQKAIVLPAKDSTILLNWAESKYGF